MIIQTSGRGFISVMSPSYLPPYEKMRLISESSAIGNYDNSIDNPGSSYLWIGQDHHLNREEVAELIEYMRHWLEHGKLKILRQNNES